jgi:hypothetical protein
MSITQTNDPIIHSKQNKHYGEAAKSVAVQADHATSIDYNLYIYKPEISSRRRIGVAPWKPDRVDSIAAMRRYLSLPRFPTTGHE